MKPEAEVILFQMPTINLVRERDGRNLFPNAPDAPNLSLQETATTLVDRYRLDIINLKRTAVLEEDNSVRQLPMVIEEYGQFDWEGDHFTKLRIGNRGFRESLQEAGERVVKAKGVIGFTSNFLTERGLIAEAIHIVTETTNGEAIVVVGGRDAMADPDFYIRAGAAAVVRNMDGNANQAAIEYVTGQKVSSPLTPKDAVINRQMIDYVYEEKLESDSAAIRIIPPRWIIRKTMGLEHWENPLPAHLDRIGAFKKIWRVGDQTKTKSICDRSCYFCTVPLLGRPDINKTRLDLEASKEYILALKAAGARTISFFDDQLLFDVLYPGGEERLIEFFNFLRKEGLAWVTGNGVEIGKLLMNRGIKSREAQFDPLYKQVAQNLSIDPRNTELNEPLIKAVCGWDSETLGWDGTPGVGCIAGYWPGEDPVMGVDARGMRKLLAPEDHIRTLKGVFRLSGMKQGSYAWIMGGDGETYEHMMANIEVARQVKEAILSVDPEIECVFTPYALIPATGTPAAFKMWKVLEELGVADFYRQHPEGTGTFWFPKPTRLLKARQIRDAQEHAFRELNKDIKFNQPWYGMDSLN